MSINMIAARFAGRPLAIAPRALEQLLSANSLEARLPPTAANREVRGGAATSYALNGGIAVVKVVGPLLSRGDWLTEMFGIMSYADIGDAIESAFEDPAASAVLLEVDSPGGEVGGLFDLVERVREVRSSSGKPLWAVASEAALSAAYAIASSAERLYVTRTGEVGSIGVVAAHVDESAADAMAGQKWTLIQAGAKKTLGNSHEPLAPGAFAEIQTDVEALYADFVALVSANRRIGHETVRSTEAAIYRGPRALAAGLSDRIGSIATALADLNAELERPRSESFRSTHVLSSEQRSQSTMTKRATNAPETEPEIGSADPATLPAVAPPGSPASAEPPSAADRLRAEYSEIASITAQAARLGVVIDAADAMKKSVKPDALRSSVLDALAARSEASMVVSAAPQQPAPGTSPIVRRARERAAAGTKS